jgi:hypothetical protein
MEVTEMDSVAGVAASSNLMEFLIRFLLNFGVIFIVIRLIYFPIRKNKDFLFTFFLFNIINFLICFLLSTAKLKMGFAFGLFAIFSILRYRTVTVPVREMGYFFISVTIGIINALASSENNMLLLLIANGVIIILTYVIDYQINITHESYREIIYDRIDLIAPEKREEMLAVLRARTGLDIHRVEFVRVDLFKDVARIYAFYNSTVNDSPSVGLGVGDDD